MVIMKMSSTDKICMVCGDKSLGYNFNAVTCESCKAFFRRNALSNKEFTCPFNNNCEITVVTRRFCQKCRLEKCFTIGMRKEYIMSDEDKVIKRMKIEQNRAKRKSSSSSNSSNNNNSSTVNKTNSNSNDVVINETPPVKMKKTYTTLSSLRCTELSKLTEKRNSNSSYEYWDLIQNNDVEPLSIDEDNIIDSKYNLNVSNVQNYTELSSSSSSSITSMTSSSIPVKQPKTIQKPSSAVDDVNKKTLKNTINNVVATENIEKSINLPALDINSTATEIIDRIVQYPEDSSKVINHLMKTPADSLSTLTKILNSQKDAMRLIGHLISTPGDGLKIISKIMNSPFDALTVFTKFMSSPTDAIEIIAKIASSPGEVVQFIKQLMNSPEDALQIMNKFMNSPAEALRMLNKMVNRPRVDSTSSSTIPVVGGNIDTAPECEESQEILMLNNTIIDNNIINCNNTITHCNNTNNNKEYDKPTENHHIIDENSIIIIDDNNNHNKDDSTKINDIYRNDKNVNNIMIKSMLGNNQLDSPPPLVSSSILNSPPILSPPILIDQSPLPFVSGLSTTSLPPPPPSTSSIIHIIDNVDPSLPTSTINNSTELQQLNNTIIITDSITLESPTIKQHQNDEIIQEHEEKQQPPQQQQDQEAGEMPSTSPTSSSIPSSPPDITKRILQDVTGDKPILPYSIESVLCEAIKLEYEAYNSLAQSANNSRELNDAERAKLNELIVANKALYAPLDEDLSGLIFDECNIKNNHNSQDPQLLKLVNLTAIAIRRLIKMSKKINAFKNMCQEDQVALLKGGCTEMMILRSVMQYDVDHATWKIPHNLEAMSNIKVDVLKLAKGNVYEEHENFLRTFDPKWRKDENIILIMCAIVLFTPTRPKTVHADVLKLEQNSYYYLLRRYLESVYPGCEAKSTFLKLIQKINELQRLNEVIIGVYLDVNPAQVEPLLREIFDLKNH